MITLTGYQGTAEAGIISFKGKSTDTKPTLTYEGQKILNGSSFFEIDTQNLAFYDGDTDTWLENQ